MKVIEAIMDQSDLYIYACEIDLDSVKNIYYFFYIYVHVLFNINIVLYNIIIYKV